MKCRSSNLFCFFGYLFGGLLWLCIGEYPCAAQGTFDPYGIKEVKAASEEEQIRRGNGLKAYVIDPNTGDAIRENIDTLTIGFYRRQVAEGRTLAIGYLGNLHSPWHAKLFFDRPRELSGFFYKSGLDRLIFSPQTALFYDTQSPFAEVLYHRHGENKIRESQLGIHFGANYTPKFNLGADFDYTYSNGYYNSQPTKNFNYRIFSSYRHDRYEAYFSVANDYFHIGENGGILDERYITNPQEFNLGRSQIRPRDIPVRFAGNILFNRIRQGSAFLTHRFNLGYYKKAVEEPKKSLTTSPPKQSLKTKPDEPPADSLVFVPVGSIVHSLRFTKDRRRFIGSPDFDWGKEYSNAFIHREREGRRFVAPNDTTQMFQIDNTLALSLREGFRPWVAFGLTAYARLENRAYYLMDSIAGQRVHEKGYDVYLGGEINRMSGKRLHFKGKAEIAPIGENAGTIRMDAAIKTRFDLWGKELGLDAWGYFANTRPSYLLRHHHGTFHWWDTDLSFMQRLDLGASVGSELLGLKLEARTATLRNYLYFGADAIPVQKKDPIQVLEMRAKHWHRLGALCWELEGVYQQASDDKAIPLPRIAAYAHVYLDFYIAGVMRTQLGVDARYHTAYKVPYYEPATMQFINQDKLNIGGGLPLFSAYVNAHLKRTRFFLQMYNVGELVFTPNRMSLPGYPITPDSFRVGLSVDFNN